MKIINTKEDINIFNLIPNKLHKDQELHTLINNNLEEATKPLTNRLPYEKDGALSKKNITQIPEMAWLKDIDMYLIKSTGTNPRTILDKLITRLKKRAKIIPEHISDCGLHTLALDYETTSLNTNITIEGGNIRRDIDLVGIVIAPTPTKGYYIPTNHNELDGVKNFQKEDIKYFLQRLSDEFFLVYFNFNYDGAVALLHGVELHKDKYADVMLIGDTLGLDTVQDLFSGRGLKKLSEYFLDRKQLEITQILGSKSYIQFNSISATTALTYACPDAINTLALFELFALEDTDQETNPYLYNEATLALDHRTLFHHIGIFLYGLPLNDYQGLEDNLKTIIHRLDLVKIQYENIPRAENYNISTPQKINHFIAELVLNDMLNPYGEELNLELLQDTKNKIHDKLQEFLQTISNDFGVIIKIDENKSRGIFLKAETRKVGYGAKSKGVEVLTLTKKAIVDEYWIETLSKKTRKHLDLIVKSVDTFRTLQLEIGRLGKMYRYGKADDRGFPVANISLRFNGTDTRRYSNSSGSGSPRFMFTGAKNHLVSFYDGNGLCGINAQGLPSTPYQELIPKEGCRKPIAIKSIKNKRFTNWIRATNRKLEESLKLLLKTKLNQKK